MCKVFDINTQIAERRVHVTNEEMTKQSLILPFIQVLGFDIYNPLEVRPEYIADFGKKITWSKPIAWDGAFLGNLEY